MSCLSGSNQDARVLIKMSQIPQYDTGKSQTLTSHEVCAHDLLIESCTGTHSHVTVTVSHVTPEIFGPRW